MPAGVPSMVVLGAKGGGGVWRRPCVGPALLGEAIDWGALTGGMEDAVFLFL